MQEWCCCPLLKSTASFFSFPFLPDYSETDMESAELNDGSSRMPLS